MKQVVMHQILPNPVKPTLIVKKEKGILKSPKERRLRRPTKKEKEVAIYRNNR